MKWFHRKKQMPPRELHGCTDPELMQQAHYDITSIGGGLYIDMDERPWRLYRCQQCGQWWRSDYGGPMRRVQHDRS